MTSDSPRAGLRHWSLFRATWPYSVPCSPAAGSYANGSIVASRPSAVTVIRSAAPCLASSSRTVASSAAKWAGMYILPPRLRLRAEGTGQVAPDGVVIVLAVARLHGLPGRHDHPAALEHERQRAVDLLRPQLGRAGPGERLGVRAVRGEGVVQAGPAGLEPLGLGVVDAAYQAHVLGHDVAVVPRRAEGVLADQPARREDHEVDVGQAGQLAGRGEHGEDGRVGVVEADRADHHE